MSQRTPFSDSGRSALLAVVKCTLLIGMAMAGASGCNRTPAPAPPTASAPVEKPKVIAAPTTVVPTPPRPARREIGWGEDAPLANFPKAPERDLEGELKRAFAQGMRRVDSRHMTLITDLPADPEIDRLPEAFDLAFPQWCAYFGVDPAKHADWKIVGYLVGDRGRFEQVGLFPADLPPFRHGYSRGREFWLYEQPNAYYRRHLFLHEGTHSFMTTLLGSVGPPWYSEGMAEFMATHRWDASGLKLAYFPKSREEVPELGRIKLLQDAIAAQQAFQVEEILRFGPDSHQKNEGYAWCWGLVTFLDNHPRYQKLFRQLPGKVNSLAFSEEFARLFQDDFAQLREEWQVFVTNVEHGYDPSRMIVDFSSGKPLPTAGSTVQVAADQGWQNTGWKLTGGKTYRLRAEGRYQLADQPVIWWSEPGGVSIRYEHHEPLGKLLAVVRPDHLPPDGRSVFLTPIPVGVGATIGPPVDGTLYLRINDSAGELGDNLGEARVEVLQTE